MTDKGYFSFQIFNRYSCFLMILTRGTVSAFDVVIYRIKEALLRSFLIIYVSSLTFSY
jgi:hypothetical protein